MNFIEKEKSTREETEKRHTEEKEKETKERLELQATFKQDMTEIFDAKVLFCNFTLVYPRIIIPFKIIATYNYL